MSRRYLAWIAAVVAGVGVVSSLMFSTGMVTTAYPFLTPLPTRPYEHDYNDTLVMYPGNNDYFSGVINGASQFPQYLYSHSTLLWPGLYWYPTYVMDVIKSDFRAIDVTDPDNKCKTWLRKVCKWSNGDLCQRTHETQSVRYSGSGGVYYVTKHKFKTFETDDIPPFPAFTGVHYAVWPSMYYDSIINMYVPLTREEITFKGQVGNRENLGPLNCAGPY